MMPLERPNNWILWHALSAAAFLSIVIVSSPAAAGCQPRTYTTVAVSQDGELMLTCGNFSRPQCRLWSRKSRKVVRTLTPLEKRFPHYSRDKVEAWAMRAAQKMVARRYPRDFDKRLRGWEAATMNSADGRFSLAVVDERSWRFMEIVDKKLAQRWPILATRKPLFGEQHFAESWNRRLKHGMYATGRECLRTVRGFCVIRLVWLKDTLRLVMPGVDGCGVYEDLYEVSLSRLDASQWSRPNHPRSTSNQKKANSKGPLCRWHDARTKLYTVCPPVDPILRDRFAQARGQTGAVSAKWLTGELYNTVSYIADEYGLYKQVWDYKDKAKRIALVKGARKEGAAYVAFIGARILKRSNTPDGRIAITKLLRRWRLKIWLNKIDASLLKELEQVAVSPSGAVRDGVELR